MRCCVDPPWKCRNFRAGSIVNSQWQLFPAAQDYQPNTHLWSARRIRDSGVLLSVALKRLCGGLACGFYRCARVIDLLGDRRRGVIKNDYCYCSITWRILISSLPSKAPCQKYPNPNTNPNPNNARTTSANSPANYATRPSE